MIQTNLSYLWASLEERYWIQNTCRDFTQFSIGDRFIGDLELYPGCLLLYIPYEAVFMNESDKQ
jgi:hypothetical protein